MLDELDQLEHITTYSAPETVPALLVDHDVQRTVRLARMVRAIAEQRLLRLLHNATAE